MLVAVCELDFHVFWWLWQFLHHLVTVTVFPPSGDCDSFFTIWWLWQFLHHLVTVTVSPPSGDCGSVSTIWWLWQFLHHLVTVAVSPPSGDCDSFSTIWWLWQCLHHLVTVSFSTIWWHSACLLSMHHLTFFSPTRACKINKHVICIHKTSVIIYKHYIDSLAPPPTHSHPHTEGIGWGVVKKENRIWNYSLQYCS